MLSGLTLGYNTDLLERCNSTRSLQSPNLMLLKVPSTNTVLYGDHAFRIAAPKLWNSVSYEIRTTEDLNLFQSKLKTHLFRIAHFELFCLQNSLIVGMQPVGWFLGGPCSAFPTTVEVYRKASCRGRNKNADENARKILLLKRHYESVRISFA